ncbi:MAG: hypothetical protein QM756_35435 [Polyangiaceae bacterium]
MKSRLMPVTALRAGALASTLAVGACGGNSLELDGRDKYTLGNEEHVFYRQQGTVYAIQVDAQRLYWISGSSVRPSALRSCVSTACDDTVVTYADLGVVTDQRLVWTFTVADGMIYWAHPRNGIVEEIVSCPVSGCQGAPTFITEGYQTRSILVRGQTIYWSSETDRAILSCPLVGCSTPKVVAANMEAPVGLSATSEQLYFGSADQVFSYALDGGSPPRVFLAEQSGVGAVLATTTDLFWWVGGDTRRLVSCPLPGCAGAPRVVTQDEFLYPFVADAERAYWLSSDVFATPPNTSIRGVDLTMAGTPFEFYRGESASAFGPVWLAMNADYVYWAGWGTGDSSSAALHSAIYRMAR